MFDEESIWKISCYVALAIVGLVVLQFSLRVAGLEWFRFFGKYQRNVERDVYENNKSFVDAKLDTLRDRWLSYKEAGESEKQTVCLTVQQEFEDFDASKVKIDQMRSWLSSIQRKGCS